MPDVDRHFRRVGSGDQIRSTKQVEEVVRGQPFPSGDDLVAHHRDVGGGSSKGSEAQAQEGRGKLS
jgi:hypothetical protein